MTAVIKIDFKLGMAFLRGAVKSHLTDATNTRPASAVQRAPALGRPELGFCARVDGAFAQAPGGVSLEPFERPQRRNH